MTTIAPPTGGLAGPRRVAIYVRVSSEEQIQGYSLDAQEHAGRAYCRSHEWRVYRVYRDEGRSARTDDVTKRPEFAQMLIDADAGAFDTIVVHKLDRFARNRRVAFESFHRLGKCGVGFVSIAENLDYSTPAGQLMLTMLVGLSQFYSDNLSAETKKGKAERKRQGLYNGLLPFGAGKDTGGAVVADPGAYEGLLLAFRTAAEGKSDREVADVLNLAGFRTTGNRGPNPFSKDTVRKILTNRFYLGELPDQDAGWIPGQQAPLIESGLFERVQQVRLMNSSGVAKVRRNHRRYSLTGLAACGHCGGKLHFNTSPNGHARYYCYQRQQSTKCPQRSGMLRFVDDQLAEFLSTFKLPENIVTDLLAMYEHIADGRDNSAARTRELTLRLNRIKELYSWGDMKRTDYLSEREHLQLEIASLTARSDQRELLSQASMFLNDLPAAWHQGQPAQRNALANLTFQSVEITDTVVTAVVPTKELAPFFNLAALKDNPGQAMVAAPDYPLDVLTGGSDGIRTRDLSLDRAAC